MRPRRIAHHLSALRLVLQDAHFRRTPRRRPPELSTPTPPRSPLLTPLVTPRLSINRLLALHPHERLLVHPLRWTNRQPALLGCRIYSHHDEAHSAAADENAGTASSKSDRLASLLAKRLNGQLDPERLADTVKKLLAPLDASRILFQMEYVHPMSTAHVLVPTNLHVLTPLG